MRGENPEVRIQEAGGEVDWRFSIYCRFVLRCNQGFIGTDGFCMFGAMILLSAYVARAYGCITLSACVASTYGRFVWIGFVSFFGGLRLGSFRVFGSWAGFD